jgi:nitric oxide reductase subunit B
VEDRRPVRKLWWLLALMFLASFTALGLIGGEIYQKAPPVPERFVDEEGAAVYTRADVDRGRLVWQSMGGHQLGSIWGHGSYVAPDWTADWLHRESIAHLNRLARERGADDWASLPVPARAETQAILQQEVRANTYDPQAREVLVGAARAEAIREVAAHYETLFGDDPSLTPLREQYALHENAIPDADSRRQLAGFIFWTAWAASTQRPDSALTYTSNWPHEPLVGNVATAGMGIWSVASIILLLAALGGMVWWHAARAPEPELQRPAADPFAHVAVTPSMRATLKYFVVVALLFLAQVALGGITAHYAVEGHSFYGIPLSEWLPYSVARTWHTQLGIFWIATAWLATGLYVAPLLGGAEPRFQRLGVNLLFVALLVVVVGSFAGEWLGVQQMFDVDTNWWLGHQGWEFVDLGRVWQILLFVGLMIWLVLVGRALAPALKRRDENHSLVWLVFLSTVCIGLFYGAGLSWGKHTSLSMVEYWRWWVVHLWVEGFFEVFATAVIALLFTRLGLVRVTSATRATLAATIIFLSGGILGTLHHLYFAGTTMPVIAIGAVFSALEVVPLVLIGFEALENYRHGKGAAWLASYRWAIWCFVAVAFWNLVGAGLLGFLINPPISLYFVQGLNTTPTHGHAALFGVYGMLGVGLMLFCLRGLTDVRAWNTKLLAATFWCLNGGLAAMVFLSLLPAGIYQAAASISEGFWYARSPEVIHSAAMETFVWMRVPGDIIFSAGALAFALFLFAAIRGRLRPAPADGVTGTAKA